jgi:tetratricopeptide (TPR) repeat protein
LVVFCAAGLSTFAGQRPTQSEHLDVIFTSDLPETEIYLEGEKIGMTGTDGQLLVKLKPGEYHVMIRRAGYYTQQRTIYVSTRLTTFKFFMGMPIPPPSPTPTPSLTPTPTPTSSPSPTPTPTPQEVLKTVLERFLDPQQTDQVKLADWQNLLSSTYQELANAPNDSKLKAQAQFAQGQIEYLNKNYANALDAFSSAQRLAPDFALASYGLGNVYLATIQPLPAVRSFERAVGLNPQLGMAYKGLGDALTSLKKRKEAEAAYTRARDLGYMPQGASLSMARNFVKEERWADALPGLQELATKEPSAEVYILLGDAYAGQKQTINAYNAYTKATELDKASAVAFYKLGELQLRENNNPEAARDALERALALDPTGLMIDRRRARKMADDAGSKLRKLNKDRVPKPSIP